MKLNNFWGNSRSRGMQVGVIVRLGLALAAIAGSISLAWVLLGGHYAAHASSINSISTIDQPLGMVIDSHGNAWVAEPNCNPAPACGPSPKGAIEEFKINGGGLANVKTYQPPSQINPAYLAVDSVGNVWFTDPSNNLIGKLNPSGNSGSGSWTTYTNGLTSGAEPYGMVIDKNGKIWFAERAALSTNGAKIGFLDPSASTPAIVETAVPSANSNPFGMTIDSSGNIWFTEDTNGKLGTFTPTTNGHVTITEHATGTGAQQLPAHMITADKSGNLWYSEGGTDLVGEYTISSGATHAFNVSSGICPTPGVTPTTCNGTFISGIGVDSTGKVWFDESQNNILGSLNPTTGVVTPYATTAHYPGEGLAIDASNNVWVSMLFGYAIDELPAGSSPSPTPSGGSPSPSPTPNLPPGPVSKTWYFAEGHIGNTFQEYLTVQNPDPVNSCAVSIQYLLPTGPQTPIKVTVNPQTRWTENVDQDLGVSRSGTFAEDVSTIVTVNNTTTPNCKGVVAERPMYFTNLFGASSGHDAVGATHLNTSFYFDDIASFTGYRDFITILNPPTNTSAASITVNYYQGGVVKGQSTLSVPAGTRGTITPPNFTIHVSALVQSSVPVAVERPAYFSNFVAGNAGTVSGATDVVGAQAPSNDWRFAEGYIGGKFQEDILLSNFSTTAITTTMVLEYDSGTTYTISIPVGPQDTALEDINYITAHASTLGGTCSTPCTLTQNISAEITAPSGSNFVAERELYFQYNHVANGRTLTATGGTDILGQSGAANISSYSFAEGYTNTGYDEWLTLQNPSGSSETIWVTLVNGLGKSYSFSDIVGPKTRATVDLVKTVLANMCKPGAVSQCWEVSMTVQTINNGGAFVAERPMYFNASGSQGGTVVIGYAGG